MKATGIVRNIEENRRVCIPKELARATGFPEKGGYVEFFTAHDSDLDTQVLILVPYKMKPELTERMQDFLDIYNDLRVDLEETMEHVDKPNTNIADFARVIKEYIEENYR